MLIGCDPKRDSTINIVGKQLKPLLELIVEKESVEFEEVVHKGYNGVLCVEIGGPEPGIGCAGRGLLLAFKTLKDLGVFDLDLDLIIYDVPGDVVCGGFAVPMRRGYAREVYIVTSGEYLSLFAANNICKAIRRVGAKLGGIICNSRGVKGEIEIVKRFAEMIGSRLIGVIPRSKEINLSELNSKTVLEFMPESDVANIFRRLAEEIWKNEKLVTPRVLTFDELRSINVTKCR